MDPLYWSIALIACGLIVVVLEVFIPSAGVLGVLAAVLVVSGIAVGFVDSFQTGAVMLLVTSLLLPVLFVVMVKVWPNTPIGRLILVQPPKSEDVIPVNEHLDAIKKLVNKVGYAKSKMLPSGIIAIDGVQYDAVSEGFAIEAGEPVKVIEIRSNRIYVQPYNPEDDLETHFNSPDLLERSIEELGLNE